MTSNTPIDGFPAVGKGTVLPNMFFTGVLPQLREAGDLLAFLWVSRLVQEQRGHARFVTASQVWEVAAARLSFEATGAGRPGLERGLERCRELGALLALRLAGERGEEMVYFINNPGSRRVVARARAGELKLRPQTVVLPVEQEQRPGIFRLYEENIGTVTPLVGERLLMAIDDYPPEWIEEAFREAAELNRRSWRYIERILQNWAQEGRGYEAPGRDSFEERKRRYLGGAIGGITGQR
ncbi:MAG: DnaD domain protein [Dehalococcoidia bacterium]|nr:DnaD domain protein [Dehalococcoidia bacterium]